jgi:hypothetical protein
VLNRTEKREQLNKKQQADLDAKEKKEDAIDNNPQLDRQKRLEKKTARDKIIEERKLEQEAKKKDFEDRRQKILDERAAKKWHGFANATTGRINETSKTLNRKENENKC